MESAVRGRAVHRSRGRVAANRGKAESVYPRVAWCAPVSFMSRRLNPPVRTEKAVAARFGALALWLIRVASPEISSEPRPEREREAMRAGIGGSYVGPRDATVRRKSGAEDIVAERGREICPRLFVVWLESWS